MTYLLTHILTYIIIQHPEAKFDYKYFLQYL